MKLCKDCKHIQIPSYASDNMSSQAARKYSRCTRLKKEEMEPVTGQVVEEEIVWCTRERKSNFLDDIFGKHCGKEGKYWEPK